MLAVRRSLAIVVAAVALASCGAPPGAVSGGSVVTSASDDPATTTSLRPQGPVVPGVRVERVVDGDTIKVELEGEYVSVRLIGMNTPETVKPESPVECFGPESSDYAKSTLTGQVVTLEFDDTQGRTDQYERVLAYVWRELPDGSLRLFNLESIADGYAFERQYGPTPYAWKDEFAEAQRQAQAADTGLWGACPD